jgi:hypothetical protein
MNTDKPILFNLCSSVFICGHDAFGVFQQALKRAPPSAAQPRTNFPAARHAAASNAHNTGNQSPWRV